MFAVSCGHEAIARLLIGLGAVVDQANSSGRTPLHYAVSLTIRTSTTLDRVSVFCLPLLAMCGYVHWVVAPAHSSYIICSTCIARPYAVQQGRRRHHPMGQDISRHFNSVNGLIFIIRAHQVGRPRLLQAVGLVVRIGSCHASSSWGRQLLLEAGYARAVRGAASPPFQVHSYW